MAEKVVTVTHGEGRTRQFKLTDSPRKGMRYHLSIRGRNFHMVKLESVESFFKKKFPNAEIEID